MAQQRFPGGKDATPESYYDFGPSIKKTKEWLTNGEPVIYEAAFLYDRVLAALDILIHQNGEVWAVEVKSSTSVKDYHLTDGSLQYWAMSNSGCCPDRFFLMHINNQYVKKGELDVQELFTLTDITEEVVARKEEVPLRVAEMMESLASPDVPETDIGPHCDTPFACDFRSHCWRHIPGDSVFTLNRLRGERAWRYYSEGIYAVADLPEEDHFTTKQRLQIDGVKQGTTHIEKTRIGEWLDKLHYPLYFLDFETINPGIPIYAGSRPYEQIPVQYSLHIVDHPGATPRHQEFLASFEQDPRKEMAEALFEALGNTGHIIAYNMSFEKRCINTLAAFNPALAKGLSSLNSRFIDLMTPFQKGWYYTPEMKGSYSIKYVLPALIKNDRLSYSALSISNGGDASTYLQALAESRVKSKDLKQVRTDLLAYCKLDTLAMVKIWKKLETL